MARRIVSEEEREKNRKEVAEERNKITKFLSAERHTHPDKVTNREINLLNDWLSVKPATSFRPTWSFDEVADLMEPTIARIPSKEQIATLMRGKLPTGELDYWTSLYHCLNGNEEKEIGKNIIQAAAIATETFSDSSFDSSRCSLIGFYNSLIETGSEKNSMATNPELTTLMISEINKKLKSKPTNEVFKCDLTAAKEFLRPAANLNKNYPKGISQCRELMTTIHGIENNQLKEMQVTETKEMEAIFSYQPPVKSWQKG